MLTREQLPSDPDDKEYMATLAKGLAVLGAFGRQRPSMTLSEAALAVNVSRATARRILRTLTALGYVGQSDRQDGTGTVTSSFPTGGKLVPF
jgi:IclR family pca regulon transcriptional regulator